MTVARRTVDTVLAAHASFPALAIARAGLEDPADVDQHDDSVRDAGRRDAV